MRKSLFLAGLLAFSSLVFAKSYDVVINSPAKVGSAQLAQGVYSVTVQGDKAIFTDEHHKATTITVKLDTGTGKKFQFTSMEATKEGGTEIIKLIHLGGSTTTIEFGD